MYCPMIITKYNFHFVTSVRITLHCFTSYLDSLIIDLGEVSIVGFMPSFLIWSLSHILAHSHVERFGWREKKTKYKQLLVKYRQLIFSPFVESDPWGIHLVHSFVSVLILNSNVSSSNLRETKLKYSNG